MKSDMPKSKHVVAHASNQKKGMGDYYGTGILAKIGRQREGVGFESVTPKMLKIPPKNLA